MNDTKSYAASQIGPLALTFLAGATLGALVVALTTPKSGPEVREDLKKLARSAKRRAHDLTEQAGESWDDLEEGAGQAASELKRGATEAAKAFQES